MAALCLLIVPAALHAVTLSEVLAKMDESGPAFQSMSAGLRKLSHTAVINDTTEESGTIQLKRVKPRELQALIEFTKPDPKTVAFGRKKAEIFFPKLNTVQEYNLSRYSGLTDLFMLVGFGTSGKELASTWDAKLAGEETVGGKKAVKLELVPKLPAHRERIRKVELWLADGGAYPIQQKFIQPSGDYTTFAYSDVKINPALPAEALKLKLPKGVKRETPQH